MRRRGAAKGTGSGYKNLRGFPKDPMVHRQSAKGMKQPQKIPIISKYIWQDRVALKHFGRSYENLSNPKQEVIDHIFARRYGSGKAKVGGLGDKKYGVFDAYGFIITAFDKKEDADKYAQANKGGNFYVKQVEIEDHTKEKIVGGLGDKPSVDKFGDVITFGSSAHYKVIQLNNGQFAIQNFRGKIIQSGFPDYKKAEKGVVEKEREREKIIDEENKKQNRENRFYNIDEKFINDKLKGGLGDNRPDSDFPAKELKKGIKVEMEHTNDPEVAKEVTKDHLTEFPKGYYEELDKMEKKLQTEQGVNIKDIKPTEIRHQMGAESVGYQWHNKNKSGGNFGYNINYEGGDKYYMIKGRYDTTGKIRSASISRGFTAGKSVPQDKLTDLTRLLNYLKEQIQLGNL
jgi:hypothetical protein